MVNQSCHGIQVVSNRVHFDPPIFWGPTRVIAANFDIDFPPRLFDVVDPSTVSLIELVSN